MNLYAIFCWPDWWMATYSLIWSEVYAPLDRRLVLVNRRPRRTTS